MEVDSGCIETSDESNCRRFIQSLIFAARVDDKSVVSNTCRRLLIAHTSVMQSQSGEKTINGHWIDQNYCIFSSFTKGTSGLQLI